MVSTPSVLIEHAVLITMDPARQVFPNGHLIVRDGKIEAIGSGDYPGAREGLEVKDVKGQIVMPGLVNAHYHSYGNLLKGHMEATTLEVYFLYVLAEAPHITLEDAEISCALGSLELLQSGCTAVLDHLSQTPTGLAAASRVYGRMGVRVMLTPQFSDLSFADSLPSSFAKAAAALGPAYTGPPRDQREILAALEETIRDCHRPDEGVTVAIGPSAPVRCSDELLVASADLARRYELRWHTHLLESRAQARKSAERYGRSMLEHLDELGVLNERVSLAHAVWVSDGDLDRIKSSESTVVHVPVANLLLGDGLMHFQEARRHGIPVALGTDSSACAGCQSMFEAMKLAAILTRVMDPHPDRWPTAWDALHSATMDGARALGLQEQIGSLQIGKSADLLFLRRDLPALTPLHAPIWQVVFGRPEGAVAEVWIRGRPILVDGHVGSLDRQGLLSEAAARGAHLLVRCRDAYSDIRRQAPAFAAAMATLLSEPGTGESRVADSH